MGRAQFISCLVFYTMVQHVAVNPPKRKLSCLVRRDACDLNVLSAGRLLSDSGMQRKCKKQAVTAIPTIPTIIVLCPPGVARHTMLPRLI